MFGFGLGFFWGGGGQGEVFWGLLFGGCFF